MARARPRLRALADRLGILPAYAPADGGPPRPTPDATREALAGALGFEAGDEAAAARALARLDAEPPAPPPPPRRRCLTPSELLDGGPAFGVWANLYAVRRAHDFGAGDLSSLRELARLAGAAGAAFVGVNPLHAVRNRGGEISPYTPTSRLFRNPLYLDVEAVPWLRDCAEARRLLDAPAARAALRALRGAERIDHEAVIALKERVLHALHRAFAARRDGDGARAWRAFRRRGGDVLLDFATFAAIDDHQAARGVARDWRAWPAELRDPRREAVAAFRRRHAADVDFHLFVQFELDRQLGAAARAARRAGCALGIYQDLALGSTRSGFDVWAFRDAFVEGVTLGAPPDAYAAKGQDWGLPPLDPRRLRADGYALFRRLLRAGFEHAGALRIDHVLGLFRQWWIPAGRPASEGAYVRFPARDLLAVLADESRRHRALAIGEDLGTVGPGVYPALARFGVLSSRVLFFERERSGRFRPARRYSPRALVTANTHDLPTLAAFLSGRDLLLRRELGLLGDDAALARAREARDAERAALLARLRAGGHLRGSGTPDYAELCAAVHAFLCATPAPLVGLSLDDLAGETEPVNVPGVGSSLFPSWTRRMRRTLPELARDPGVRRALAGARARGACPR